MSVKIMESNLDVGVGKYEDNLSVSKNAYQRIG